MKYGDQTREKHGDSRGNLKGKNHEGEREFHYNLENLQWWPLDL